MKRGTTCRLWPRRETLDAALALTSPYAAEVPIVFASVLPDSASSGVEAWTVFREDGRGDHVVLYTESSVFIRRARDRVKARTT